MKRADLPMLFDLLFYGACAFVFFLCLLRYFRVPVWLSLLSAALLALAVAGALFLPMFFRRRRRQLSKAERERREALLLHLALEREEGVREALRRAYLADGKEAVLREDRLLIEGVPLFPLFSMEPVSADAVASLLRQNGTAPFSVACNALSADAERLLSSFGRDAMRGEDVFALFERTQTTPDPLICGQIPRKTAKQKLRRVFSRANARPFFTSGVLLLVMSLFTLFPVYYLTAGGLLLFCAVCLRLFA